MGVWVKVRQADTERRQRRPKFLLLQLPLMPEEGVSVFSAKSASWCLLQGWSTEGRGHPLFCFSHGLSLLPLLRDLHPLWIECSSLKTPVSQCQRDWPLGITRGHWLSPEPRGASPLLSPGALALSWVLLSVGPEPQHLRVALYLRSSLLPLSPVLSGAQRPKCRLISSLLLAVRYPCP